jgi:hypothetical protein
MQAASIRFAVLAVAVLAAGCAGVGTSRVGDELTATSLNQTKKAVALIKLGAADPLCTTLVAGIGVRDGDSFRHVQFARIVRKVGETAVAELELSAGEYHVVSYSCTRQGRAVLLAEPLGGGLYKKSYASFNIAPGEIINIGYLQLVPMGTSQLDARVMHVRLAVTDWPLAELDRFKQQRPNLYAQMRTRLMKVHRVEPPTLEQIRTVCAEMRRLHADGKIQQLPAICTPGGMPTERPPVRTKKSIGV